MTTPTILSNSKAIKRLFHFCLTRGGLGWGGVVWGGVGCGVVKRAWQAKLGKFIGIILKCAAVKGLLFKRSDIKYRNLRILV